MATLSALKSKWFIGASDVPSGMRVPVAHDGTEVEVIADGKDYFQAFYDAVSPLTGAAVTDSSGKTRHDFIWIANWNLEASLKLPDPRPPSSDATLLELLGEKAQDGVDVRVLIWFGAWSVPDWTSQMLRWLYSSPVDRLKLAQYGPQQAIVRANWQSAAALRTVKALKNRVLLDHGAYMLGAHHMKVASVYDATNDALVSFCGGMDFVSNRWGEPGHDTGSPLVVPGTLPAPTLADAGAGALPAATYHVRYLVLVQLPDGSAGQALSNDTTITLGAGRKIAVSNVGTVSGAAKTIHVLFVRRDGIDELDRAASSVEDMAPGTTLELNADPSTWGKELTLWEWHDAAAKLRGGAAGTVAEVIRNRWNDVAAYPPLDLFDTVGSAAAAVANPKEPVGTMTSPTLLGTGAGPLQAGEYHVLYTVESQLGSLDLLHVSKPTKINLDANRSIAVSNLPLDDGITGTTTTKRSIWVATVGTPLDYRRALDVAGPADTTATITTAAATWTDKLADLADWAAKPAPLISDAVATVGSPDPNESSQVLLTVADTSGPLSWLSGTTRSYSWVPKTGEFTVYYAYKKAVAQATRYIYVEDQAMASEEFMKLVLDRMNTTAGAGLKLLMVTSGQSDPGDGNVDVQMALGWNGSINDVLLAGLPTGQKSNVRLFRSRGITVHTKAVVIDDEWAAVGSANMLDRSYSTDTELQVSFVDSAGAKVTDLRQRLWAEHLSIPSADPAYAALTDVDKGLHMWVPAWGTDPGLTLPTPRRAAEIPLPASVTAPTPLSAEWWQIELADWTTHDF